MRHHATVTSITCPFGVEHTTHCFADAGFENVHAGHTHWFSFRVTAITAGGFVVDAACVSACVCSISRARFAAKTSGLNCAGLHVTKRPFSFNFRSKTAWLYVTPRRNAHSLPMPEKGDEDVDDDQQQRNGRGGVSLANGTIEAVEAVVAETASVARAMAVGVTVGGVGAGEVAIGTEEADDAIACIAAGEERGRKETCCRFRGRCRWWRCRREGCRWGR